MSANPQHEHKKPQQLPRHHRQSTHHKLSLLNLPTGRPSTDRGVKGLYIYFTVTVDHFGICDSLPTDFQQFVNGLDINVKTKTLFWS